MSTLPADVLRDQIDKADDQIAVCDQSMANTDAQIAELQKKQDGIKNGMCTPISQQLNTYLESLYPAPNYLACGGLLYNDSTNQYGVGNLTDFYVLQKKLNNSVWTRMSSTTIRFIGDARSLFTGGGSICGFATVSGSALSNKSIGSPYSVTFDASSNYTYCVCTLGIISSAHNWIFFGVVRSYNNPVDPNVETWKTKWEFGHDSICQPVGTGGTYGTKDMMAKLNQGKSIVQTNKTQLINSKTKFAEFASPPVEY